MKNFKAVLLIVFLCFISMLTVGYGGFSAAMYVLPVKEEHTFQKTPPESTPSKETASSEKIVSSTAQNTSAPVQSASQTSSAAVATGEGSTVSGKIIERFIGPQTASDSFGNVHIRNNTGVEVDIKKALSTAIKFKIKKNAEPQVLIVHTHTTESYMQENRDYYTKSDASRTTDVSKNMAAIGERVAAELKAAGIGVIHDKTLHDYPSYTGSYTQSAKTIKAYLKKYPSIKVVLDVHRDAVNGDGTDKIKFVSEQGGKKAAQVMLVMGSQTGNVTGFPEWKQNFRLAVRFQQKMETMYKGLSRPLYFMSRKYNQNLTTGSMLLEVGTEANSMEEALYSGTLAGKALAATLLELT